MDKKDRINNHDKKLIVRRLLGEAPSCFGNYSGCSCIDCYMCKACVMEQICENAKAQEKIQIQQRQ